MTATFQPSLVDDRGAKPLIGSRNQIVVGVDGSTAGRKALRWAVEEARRRGDHVVAAIAWRWDIDDDHDTIWTGAAGEAARTIAREIQALSAEERADVRIDICYREGRPADVLTELAAQADLLVVGSHGHSFQLHQVLGSVAEECIRNASCPVLVLPASYVG